MAPNANSRILGDLDIVTPSNTSLYGFGDVKVSRDVKPSRNVELTALSGIPELKTTSQALKIASARGCLSQPLMVILM